MTSDRDILEKLIEQMFVVITLLRTMRTISEVNPLKVAEIGKSISIKYFQGFLQYLPAVTLLQLLTTVVS